jgi:hypothetical protein
VAGAAFAAFLCLLPCAAQTENSSSKTMTDDELALAVASSLGPVGIIPSQNGFNASLITSSQWDSVSDWANVLTPSVAWRFNRYLSADVAAPIFLYMRSQRISGGTMPTATTDVRHDVVGDTVMAAHLSSRHFTMGKLGGFGDTLTGSLSAPTGSVQDGVGAGKTTYNATNHLQSNSLLAPYLDLGIGSTGRLQNRRLQRAQTSRGELLNIGVGISAELPRASTLYLEAYEQLPLGKQTIYQSDPRNGRPRVTQTMNSLAEDNGVSLSLDVRVAPHMTWSAYYSRGLRLHEDTVGFAFTFILRNPVRLTTSR